MYHTPTTCLLSSCSHDCSETRAIKLQSCSKKPVFFLTYSLQLTQSYIISWKVGSSETEVAIFLASSLHFMRTLRAGKLCSSKSLELFQSKISCTQDKRDATAMELVFWNNRNNKIIQQAVWILSVCHRVCVLDEHRYKNSILLCLV